MSLTETEILSQYSALEATCRYFQEQTPAIRDFRDRHDYQSLTFLGAGSGYCLCRSAAVSARLRLPEPACAIAAGDLMLNFSHYRVLLQNTCLVAPSRSGSTSELVKAVSQARNQLAVPCLSICARENSELGRLADLNLEIPWAFDQSVCQTRTVTNLYAANLLLIAILADDRVLLDEIQHAVRRGNALLNNHLEPLKKFAREKDWTRVVVLADSELEGIALEASLAFQEIARLPSNYHHLLDVRHGPIVLMDRRTLVILAGSPFGRSYQQDLVRDLKQKGAWVVAVSGGMQDSIGADYQVDLADYQNYGVIGIPFIFVPQVLACFKAYERGINPDLPECARRGCTTSKSSE